MIRKYSVSINSDKNVVITHAITDKSTFKFLERNIKKDAVIKIYKLTEGVNHKKITDQNYQWLVNNYSGLKQILIDFSSDKGFYIDSYVLEQLK